MNPKATKRLLLKKNFKIFRFLKTDLINSQDIEKKISNAILSNLLIKYKMVAFYLISGRCETCSE